MWAGMWYECSMDVHALKERPRPGEPGAPGPGDDDSEHGPAHDPGVPQPEDAAEVSHGEEGVLRCRACGAVATRAAFRTSADGGHRHTFCNPHGRVFEIGLFSAAEGVAVVGPPSDEFSWFPGHVWRIALCARCGVHLGWLFSGSQRRFFGLNLAALVEDTARE